MQGDSSEGEQAAERSMGAAVPPSAGAWGAGASWPLAAAPQGAQGYLSKSSRTCGPPALETLGSSSPGATQHLGGAPTSPGSAEDAPCPRLAGERGSLSSAAEAAAPEKHSISSPDEPPVLSQEGTPLLAGTNPRPGYCLSLIAGLELGSPQARGDARLPEPPPRPSGGFTWLQAAWNGGFTNHSCADTGCSVLAFGSISWPKLPPCSWGAFLGQKRCPAP